MGRRVHGDSLHRVPDTMKYLVLIALFALAFADAAPEAEADPGYFHYGGYPVHRGYYGGFYRRGYSLYGRKRREAESSADASAVADPAAEADAEPDAEAEAYYLAHGYYPTYYTGVRYYGVFPARYSHYYSLIGRKRREAEADPEADAYHYYGYYRPYYYRPYYRYGYVWGK